MFLQWELERNIPVLFLLENKRRLIVHILKSEMKYAGEFGVEDHHAGEVVPFTRDHTEMRDLTTVLIQPGNLKTLRKETMVKRE